MNPNPIRKVLSTLKLHQVKHLLMGGQACVFYGAAEFSRDTDVVLLANRENLDRLTQAMRELRAEMVAVPPLDLEYLMKGHAIHFRCRHPEADGMRLDVMSVLRGLPEFPILWDRRTTVAIDENDSVELMALPDLVKAKKTQRDKDWPMLRRLIEAHYLQFQHNPSKEMIYFWLTEARTPGLLRNLCAEYPNVVKTASPKRPLLRSLTSMNDDAVEKVLIEEETKERIADRAYWRPLRKELEQLRRKRINKSLDTPC